MAGAQAPASCFCTILRSPLVYAGIVSASAKLPVCASDVCDHVAVFVPAEPCCQQSGTAVALAGVSNDGFRTRLLGGGLEPIDTTCVWTPSMFPALSHDAYFTVVVAATVNAPV